MSSSNNKNRSALTVGPAISPVAGWKFLALLVVLAAQLNGCRAAQLLPTGLLPTAPQGDEPSFDRLLEIEDRQQGNGKQASRPAAQRGELASRRRPGYAPDESRGVEPGDRLRMSSNNLSQENAAEVVSIDDADIQRTSDALTRYVADRRAGDGAEVRHVDDAPEEAGAIEFNMNDEAESQLMPQKMADNRQPERAASRYIEDFQESDTQSPAPNERRAAPPRQLAGSAMPVARTLEEPSERVLPHIATQQGEVTNASYVQQGHSQVQQAAYESTDVEPRRLREEPSPSTALGRGDEQLSLDEHFQAISELLSASDTTLSPRENAQRLAAARLVSLARGELDTAMEPIPSLDEHEQEYFRHQVQALFNFFDTDGSPELSRRCSLVMLDERKALEQLAAISSLEVMNVSFCTDVMGFGVVTTFPANNFKSNQEVLLYCELDNFVSEKISSGYETKLDGSYEILDASGKKVYNDDLPEDSHICRSRRRDYFIAYRLYMPSQIEAGKYTLKLTIHDIKGNKYGQAEVPFQIVL